MNDYAKKYPLTQKQIEILVFIKEFFIKNWYMPTYQEIADFFNITKKDTFDHLIYIERKGYISKINNKARSYKLNGYELELKRK